MNNIAPVIISAREPGMREIGQPGTRDLVEALILGVLEFARGAYSVVEG